MTRAARLLLITFLPDDGVFSGLELAIVKLDDRALKTEINHQMLIYLLSGSLLILFLLATGSYATFQFRRQERLNKLKNDVVATVSHELKTPLTSVRLLIDNLLEKKGSLPEETREYVEILSQENTRLTRLVDNFLTYSRMERGKHRFFFEPVEIGDLIRETCDLFYTRLKDNDFKITLVVESELWIDADREMMKSALLNLIENAWKYSPDEKYIEIRAEKRNDKVRLQVIDHGMGMSEKDRLNIFDRFYRADQHLHRQTEGVGLGLSIVHYIVEKHNASIEVQSKVGEGSSFIITLRQELER